MENEIMNNEVVIEEVTEITEVDSNKGLIAFGICVAALGGVLLYKKVVKPLLNKRKAKKEQAEEIEAQFEESDVEMNDSEEN